MKAIVLYDSKYGNTEQVAKGICSGMKEVGFSSVECRRGSTVTPEELLSTEIWILGSPTHMGGVSRNFKQMIKWMGGQDLQGIRGTAFDTRLENMKGGASQRISEAMIRSGIQMLLDPESFIVKGRKGPLAEGEEARAISFGRRIAGALRA